MYLITITGGIPMKRKTGISAQILRIVLISLITSFLFVTVFHSFQYKRNTTNLVIQSNKHSAKQLSESFNTFYQQLIYITIQLASNSTVKSYMKNTPADNFQYYRMQRYVNDYLQSFTGFFNYSNVNIILYGKNNCTYSTYTETIHLEETGLLNENFMKMAKADHKTMEIDYYHKGITNFTKDNHYTFAACSMLDSNTKTSYGYVILIIDEAAFSNLFSNLSQKDNRFTVLASDGTILSDTQKSQIGTKDKELLKIAQSDSHSANYNGKDFISVSLKNPLFGFWILQMTGYSDIHTIVTGNLLLSILVGTLLFISVSIFLVITINKITGPIKNLTYLMNKIDWDKRPEETNIIPFHGCIEVEQLGNAFNHMLCQLHTYIENLYEEQNARRLAELNALQNQINPHFIYNTLTSIKYLSAANKHDDVIQGISALIQLLRKTLGDTRETISLKEEIELVESYFKIQTLRYGNGIRLMPQIPLDCMNFSVPKLFLQPLVENAIFHGFSDTAPKGDISIYATKLSDCLQIEVIDNGLGIPSETLENLLLDEHNKKGFSGIGIKNINDRIKMIYGSEYGLHISSIPGYGTQIIIRLPKIQQSKE